MSERWPGYSTFKPPPGAEAKVARRPVRGRWHLEVRWDGLVYDDGVIDAGWIDLGPLPDYLIAGDIDWVAVIDWAAAADDHLPEEP